MRSVSKRASGLLVKRMFSCIGGPVMRKRRISGRGRTFGVLIRVTKVLSEYVVVTRSVSTVKVEEMAQSSQEEQYFSGVWVLDSPGTAFSTAWQGGVVV